MEQKCPLCDGKGLVDLNPPTKSDINRGKAKALRRKGLTIRQIAAALGYKHPGSISNLLK